MFPQKNLARKGLTFLTQKGNMQQPDQVDTSLARWIEISLQLI